MADPFLEAESTVSRSEFMDRYRHRFSSIVFDATLVHRLLTLKDEGNAYENAKIKLLKDSDKWLESIYDELCNQGNHPRGEENGQKIR